MITSGYLDKAPTVISFLILKRSSICLNIFIYSRAMLSLNLRLTLLSELSSYVINTSIFPLDAYFLIVSLILASNILSFLGIFILFSRNLWFTDLISTVILRLPLSISLLPKPVILFIIKVSSFHLFIVDNIKKYFNTKCSLIHRLLNINLHIKLLITTANYINFTLTIQDNIYKMCYHLF